MKAVKPLVTAYLVGFGLSLGLTLAAFLVASLQRSAGTLAHPPLSLVLTLSVLAATQSIVQLTYFFHLGKEQKPRLNTVSFLFMLMVVGIVVFGSLWIMYHLDYNMMPHEVDSYIQNEENIPTTNSHSHH